MTTPVRCRYWDLPQLRLPGPGDRAANEGMPVVTAPDEALPHPNGEIRELPAIGDLS